MSTFEGTFYPSLIIGTADKQLVLDYARATKQEILGGYNGIVAVNDGIEGHRAFVEANASRVGAFRTTPSAKKLTLDQYSAARSLAEQVKAQAMNPKIKPVTSSSSSTPAVVPVTKKTMEGWRAQRDDGKIDPKLLEYIRAASRKFDDVEITSVSYQAGRSMSLAHRKMLNFLITTYSLSEAVRMVEEKIWVGEDLADSAITSIPKGKIEILLPEYSMANMEGESCQFLWAAFETRCVYRAGMEELAPHYIGAGSNKEREAGTEISADETHRRRVAYARNTCNYLRSLFTSAIFRTVLNEQLVAAGKPELTE